jgi:pentatricopeptide repeat protein
MHLPLESSRHLPPPASRKRKWGAQVQQVLDFLVTLSSCGFPDKGVAAQQHLRPTIIVYEAILDAYFSMGQDVAANELYAQMIAESSPSVLRQQSSTPEFVLGLIKGYLHCGNAGYAVEAYRQMRARGCLPSRAIVSGLMHGLGNDVKHAVEILTDVCNLSSSCCTKTDRACSSSYRNPNISLDESMDITSPPKLLSAATSLGALHNKIISGAEIRDDLGLFVDDKVAVESMEAPPFTRQSLQRFVCILLESCAVLENNSGLEQLLDSTGCLNSVEMASTKSPLKYLLLDLIEEHSSDFVLACLMLAVCGRSPIEAHNFVQRYQTRSVLPPFPFLYTLVEECYAPLEQVQQKPMFSGLPFAGFLRFGPVKCLDRKRKFARRALSQTNPICKPLSATNHSHNAAIEDCCNTSSRSDAENIVSMHTLFFSPAAAASASTAAAVDDAAAGAGRSPRFAPDDPLLSLLVLLSCGSSLEYDVSSSSSNVRDAFSQAGSIAQWCAPAAGALLLHHLYVKQQFVRSKLDKEMFRSDIMTAVRGVREISFRSESGGGGDDIGALRLSTGCGRVVQSCLESVSVLELPTRQSARVLSTLFECLSAQLTDDSAEIDSALVLAATSACVPSLELLKEMNRYFRLTDTAEGCLVAGEVVLALLRRGREKPIKAIQFIKQYKLDTAEAYAVQLEELIVAAFLRDDEASVWSACMSYLAAEDRAPSSLSLQHERCFRVVSQLTAHFEETGNSAVRDTAVRLICKFDLGDATEFRHLISSTLSAVVENEDDHVNEIPYENCLQLALSQRDIIWVDSEEDVDLAADLLGLGDSDAASDDSNSDGDDGLDDDGITDAAKRCVPVFATRLVGIDVEWR